MFCVTQLCSEILLRAFKVYVRPLLGNTSDLNIIAERRLCTAVTGKRDEQVSGLGTELVSRLRITHQGQHRIGGRGSVQNSSHDSKGAAAGAAQAVLNDPSTEVSAVKSLSWRQIYKPS